MVKVRYLLFTVFYLWCVWIGTLTITSDWMADWYLHCQRWLSYLKSCMYYHPSQKCVVVLRHMIYSVDLDEDMTNNVCVVWYIVHCVLLYCVLLYYVLLYCTCSVISINGPIVFVLPQATTHFTCTQSWSCGPLAWILPFILLPFIFAQDPFEMLKSEISPLWPQLVGWLLAPKDDVFALLAK